MSDDNKVLELHLKNINDSMNQVKNDVGKLYSKQDEMNVILAKNTITVKEHHMRSLRLEDMQITYGDALRKVEKTLLLVEQTVQTMDNNFKAEMKRIDDDIKPIKSHVAQVDKDISWVKSFPTSVKVIAGIAVIILAILGVDSVMVKIIAALK